MTLIAVTTRHLLWSICSLRVLPDDCAHYLAVVAQLRNSMNSILYVWGIKNSWSLQFYLPLTQLPNMQHAYVLFTLKLGRTVLSSILRALQMGTSTEREKWTELVEEMEKRSAKDRKQQVRYTRRSPPVSAAPFREYKY